MTYDPLGKKWNGLDVDQIIQKSERLCYAATLNGITDIKRDMKLRMQCLGSFRQDDSSDASDRQDKNHPYKKIMDHLYDSYYVKRLDMRKNKIP